MADIRPAASLSSNLLARRGDARPAMRRQAISHLHVPLTPSDDLGWNDIGDDQEPLPPATSLSAMISPDMNVVEEYGYDETPEEEHGALSPLTRHLEEIAQRITATAPQLTAQPRAVRPAARKRAAPRIDPSLSRKAAFTLRIDAERHLRLRLLSALTHRSSQQLLIEALDALLASHDKVEDLAGQVRAAGASR